ncbi:hypothetical protein SDC9_160958 [bioreactor metagenome]|uniref:Uncharacterized protein n=1 Tax=bioreactor metagenome TaxID=1076179 RepID=A0A645FGU8_9ZZZZ
MLELDGVVGAVRRQQYPVIDTKRAVGRERLLFENVEGEENLLLRRNLLHGLLVDHLAAGDVDEESLRPHEFELLPADHEERFAGAAARENDDLAVAEGFVERNLLHSGPGRIRIGKVA